MRQVEAGAEVLAEKDGRGEVVMADERNVMLGRLTRSHLHGLLHLLSAKTSSNELVEAQ